MALARTSVGGSPRQTSPSTSSTNTVVSTSFTPAANSLLVVVGTLGVDQSNAGTISVSNTHVGSGAWTVRQVSQNTGWKEIAFIAWCQMGAAPGAGTVTVTRSSGSVDQWLLAAFEEVTGHDAAAPEAQFKTGSSTASSLTLNLDNALTSSSMLFGVATSNNDTAGITQPSGFTEIFDVSQAGWATAMGCYHLSPSSTALTFSALTADNSVAVALEIKPASGSPPEEHDTAASLGVTIGVSATAVKRAAAIAPLALGLTAGSGDTKAAAAAATLDIDVALDAAAVMHAVTAATLGVALDVAATAERLVATAAEIGVTLTIEAAAAKVATAAMSLGVTIGLDGTAVKSAATAAVVDLAVTLAASPVKRAQAAAVLGIDLGVASSSSAIEPGHAAAALSLALACIAAAVKRAAATASLALALGVTATAVKHAAAATALDLALDTTATAEVVGPVTAAATFGIAIAIGATAVKRGGSVSTLALIVALAASSRDTAGRVLAAVIVGREPGAFTATEPSIFTASEAMLVGREP